MNPRHFHPQYRRAIENYFKREDDTYILNRSGIRLKQLPDDFPTELLGHLRSDFIEYSNSDNAAVKEEQRKLDEIVNVLIQRLTLSRTG